jgi:hypothetical protein
MSYNFSEEEVNAIFQTLLMFENIANQFDKKNDSGYHNNNNKVSTMGRIINNIDNELSIDDELLINDELSIDDELLINDELDNRFVKNEAILPSSPIPCSNGETLKREYETLITEPWDTNRNICSKAMKDEKKYVSHAIYERKVRNLKRARHIKLEKQKIEREKKRKKEKSKEKKLIGLVSKRKRRNTQIWDPSVSTKWSSIDNDYILIDF